MAAKPKSESHVQVQVRHWYRVQGGGYAYVAGYIEGDNYPFRCRVYRAEHGGVWEKNDEEYAPNGKRSFSLFREQALVEDLGAEEPPAVAEYRRLKAAALAALVKDDLGQNYSDGNKLNELLGGLLRKTPRRKKTKGR